MNFVSRWDASSRMMRSAASCSFRRLICTATPVVFSRQQTSCSLTPNASAIYRVAVSNPPSRILATVERESGLSLVPSREGVTCESRLLSPQS